LPLGATIHEMDEFIDHGPIISQASVKIEAWDTSATAYEKVLQAEIELLSKNIKRILNDDYSTTTPESSGNFNSKKDFSKLCEIDLVQLDTFENHLRILRALTHDKFKNAYFTDEATGKKVFVKVVLSLEDSINQSDT
jgi:methionyl-tRNA formyltransferase